LDFAFVSICQMSDSILIRGIRVPELGGDAYGQQSRQADSFHKGCIKIPSH